MSRRDPAPPIPRAAAMAVLALFLGAAVGAGAFTFAYAEGDSYITDDPAACGNCHVMQGHLDSWERGSHRNVAVCNDCHAPHGSLAAKYWVKGVNGLNHSLAFTTGRFPDAIQITDMNREVAEQGCRHCHQAMVEGIDPAGPHGESVSCIRCHEGVGHGP